MLAKRGANLTETTANYNDFSQFARFNTDALLALAEGSPDAVQAIYDSLYAEASEFFPTKHFLLDLSLDSLNDDGSLLRAIDMATLRFYTLIIKSKTQYPHFAATLGVNTDTDLREQDGTQFSFLLGADEAVFSVSQFEQIFAGPNGVFSIALTGTGAWVVFPLIMNNRHFMNSGIVFNMDITDLGGFISSFKLGSDSHDTLTDNLNDLKAPLLSFLMKEKMHILYVQ